MDQQEYAARLALQTAHIRRARRGNLIVFCSVLFASACSGAAIASLTAGAVCGAL